MFRTDSTVSALLIAVAASLAASSTIQAQTATMTFPSAATSVRSVGDGRVMVSEHASGRQTMVDVSDPSNPVATGNHSTGRDQWYEAASSSSCGGRALVGGRFGGLYLYDTTGPVPVQLDSFNTKYHFRGLDFYSSANGNFATYSEHNVSNTGGGLRIFELGTNMDQLAEVWNDGLVPSEDASVHEIIGDHVYQFRTAANDPANSLVRVFDIGALPAPATFVTDLTIGVNVGQADLERHPTRPEMLAAMNNGGLGWISAAVPSSPALVPVIPASSAYSIQGVTYLNSLQAVAWGTFGSGSGALRFWLVLNVSPFGGPPTISTILAVNDFYTRDMEVDARGVLYVAGTRLSTGNGELQIY